MSVPGKILAVKGNFQAGQTAKALSGYRVQSLPKDMTASVMLAGSLAFQKSKLYPLNAVDCVLLT
jgi:hypothetical protein